MESVEAGVSSCCRESNAGEEEIKSVVPSQGSLLKSIECALQLVDVPGSIAGDEALWLCDVDLLVEFSL